METRLLTSGLLGGTALHGGALSGAYLSGAHLFNAVLGGARELTQAQLDEAYGTPASLPAGLTPPGKPCPPRRPFDDPSDKPDCGPDPRIRQSPR